MDEPLWRELYGVAEKEKDDILKIELENTEESVIECLEKPCKD